MRTVSFVVIGLILAGVSFWLAKLFGLSAATALKAFSVLWLALSAVNLYLGVAKAGYPLAVELPVFAVVFGLPAVAAYFTQRWL